MESREITAVFIGTHDCYFIKKELIEQAIVCAINMGVLCKPLVIIIASYALMRISAKMLVGANSPNP